MDDRSWRVIGLDIGGSKTHAVAAAATGVHPVEMFAGSANLASVGAEEVGRQLDAVFDELGRDGVVAVCVGAAGADTPALSRRLHGLVQQRIPAATVQIVHDTRLILAAAGVDTGIALIAGTGSVAWGRTADDRTARAGGWGYLLGDEGGGFWVGLQAVRHALGLVDAGERPDPLSERLVGECGLPEASELIDHFYANPERRYWARRSGIVFDLAAAGDPAAMVIVDGAAAALAALVATVGDRLDLRSPVVLGGGLLMNQPALRDRIAESLDARGFAEVRSLTREPAFGALDLARAMVRPV